MIPITRKELYLNKIVGNNEYETPEKPISEEEFFFAEILGEAVQAPEPLTRYQMFLAKIAGREIEIPYPETRLEYFLARAAGVDITVPVPITREEIFWADYALIELNGIPPLTFNAIAGTLKNYRIHGNTVNSESVGDKTQNICTNIWRQGVVNDIGVVVSSSTTVYSDFIAVTPNVIYSLTRTVGTNYNNLRCFDINKNHLGNGMTCADKANPASANKTFGTFMITDQNVAFIRFNDASNSIETKYMMVEGAYTEQTMPAYEPYGYRVPVTVTNGMDAQTTNIYLPEQIKIVGNEAEYIDFGEQKQYFADGTSVDVILPALPTLSGTNTLSVGTEVQPSGIEIKGRIQEVTP